MYKIPEGVPTHFASSRCASRIALRRDKRVDVWDDYVERRGTTIALREANRVASQSDQR